MVSHGSCTPWYRPRSLVKLLVLPYVVSLVVRFVKFYIEHKKMISCAFHEIPDVYILNIVNLQKLRRGCTLA